MTTELENYLFNSDGTHALISVVFKKNQLELKIAPWTNLSKVKTFLFENVKTESAVEPSTDELPFDIIGVDSTKLSPSLWKICIHCSENEYLFQSQWPIRI